MTRGIQGIEYGPYYRERKSTPAAKKSTKEGLFFGKRGPAVVSRLARGVASRVTTNKANLRTLQKSSTNEEVPGNAVGQGGVNMAPNMGPRIKAMNVTDRRRRKDKQPVMLKRFRTFVDEK